MSGRYNTIDIAVGTGMCAIFFGALLFFAAANGTYRAADPAQPLSLTPSMPVASGMIWFQPALGQAIVDQALSERRADRTIAMSAYDWNQATLAQNEVVSGAGGSLGTIIQQAVTVPASHTARVQGIMGQAIVNFTKHGVRNGLLSADLSNSPFNLEWIRKVEIRGMLLQDQFASTWQATLGRRIVEAAQQDSRHASALQERLGTAVINLSLAQMEAERVRAVQQEIFGGFILAATLAQPANERSGLAASVAPAAQFVTIAAAEPAAWPEIPLSYLLVATGISAMAFFMGLLLAARSREETELARIRHHASRWVYHPAS